MERRGFVEQSRLLREGVLFKKHKHECNGRGYTALRCLL